MSLIKLLHSAEKQTNMNQKATAGWEIGYSGGLVAHRAILINGFHQLWSEKPQLQVVVDVVEELVLWLRSTEAWLRRANGSFLNNCTFHFSSTVSTHQLEIL